MSSSHPTTRPCHWFSRLASALDPRSAPRLALLFLGAILASGRRTVTSWIRAAGLPGEDHHAAVVAELQWGGHPAGGSAAGCEGRGADSAPTRLPDRELLRGRGPPRGWAG